MLAVPPVTAPLSIPASVAMVPFYSQFQDISSARWQKVGCGVTSLAMIIDFYKPDAVSVNTLLSRGIASGAYDASAGWKHQGLVQLSKKYGLDGSTYDLSGLGSDAAFAKFKTYVKGGPVIASVHYKFDPASTIPHMVVIDSIIGDTVYYNDPASKSGQKTISSKVFRAAWKKNFIVVRPVDVKIAATIPAAPATSAAPTSVSIADIITNALKGFWA